MIKITLINPWKLVGTRVIQGLGLGLGIFYLTFHWNWYELKILVDGFDIAYPPNLIIPCKLHPQMQIF